MKLLYFARLRERLGRAEEVHTLPAGVGTVAGLVGWLRERGEPFSSVFMDMSMIRVAVNHDYASPETAVTDGDEIAFFPPVTGGRM